MGKCAQFPLHLWLDEAMEGPNPASILRNSVVVTCGAYVLIRLQPIVVLSPVALSALVIMGADGGGGFPGGPRPDGSLNAPCPIPPVPTWAWSSLRWERSGQGWP
jgi:hypothetical protein